MKKILWSGLVGCFLLLLSCGESTTSEAEQQVIQTVQQALAVKEGQTWNYAIEQAHFNEDAVKDYIITCSIMGHLSMSVFVFDGATLNEIKCDPNTCVLSRSGVPIDVQLVDVIPDTPQEIIMYHGGGGRYRSDYYWSLYKVENGRLKRLLLETVSIINKESALINHIEIADNNQDGTAEILVYAGEIKNRLVKKAYNKNTKAIDDVPKKIYCYDKERQIYQENTYGENCY